jgi:hypothetical protein
VTLPGLVQAPSFASESHGKPQQVPPPTLLQSMVAVLVSLSEDSGHLQSKPKLFPHVSGPSSAGAIRVFITLKGHVCSAVCRWLVALQASMPYHGAAACFWMQAWLRL